MSSCFRPPPGRVPVLLLAILFAQGCTLTFSPPVGPPPDSWSGISNSHPRSEAFQGLLGHYAEQGLPGVVLLVRTPEGQWNGAAGAASIEGAEAMVPTHRHHAASITKMFMSAAVLLLAEDGLIGLDDPIGRYLSDPVSEPIPNGSQATVRQLLSHTSGIPDFSGAFGYDLDFLNDPTGAYPPDRLLSYLHGQSPIFRPGTGYFYSNANYFLLAQIVDEVVEGGHAEVFTRRILGPLGLRGTYYKNEVGYPSPPGLVNSYQDLAGDGRLMNVSDLVMQNSRIFAGNAGLITTTSDLARFIEGLLEGELIGAELLGEMLAWGDRSKYGLGINTVETPFGGGIGHSGADFGVLGQVRHFPDRAATLVLLANGGDSGRIGSLFRQLWDEAVHLAMGDG